jgi:cobalt-zinc-cadmium efflux system protein
MENKNKLLLAIFLNLIIVFSQIGFGIYSKSIALITDAVHNFQDVVSLIIAFIAAVYMQKKPTEYMTYGYLRSEVMAGFINSAILIGAVVLIIFSSVERLFYPQEVESIYVVVVGFIGFIVNAFSAYLLGFHHHHHGEDHHHHDLNIKAAYLHLISDAGMSLGVVLGGLFMYFYNLYWIDPLISILFSLYILKETLPVLKKSYFILMESVPQDISILNLKKEILSIEHIKEIHDVHVWALSSKDIYFTGHIVLDSSISVEEFDALLEKIKKILKDKGINHITIQPETEKYRCENTY